MPRSSRRLVPALLGALALAPVLPASPCTAGDRAEVTVTITRDGTMVNGTVSSPRASCLAGRQVVLMQQFGGQGGGDDMLFHASAISLTDPRHGAWSADFTLPPGHYYALMRRTPDCRRDTSRTVQIPPTRH